MATRLSFCGKSFCEADVTPADGGKSIAVAFENHPAHAVYTAAKIIEKAAGVPSVGSKFESDGEQFVFSRVVYGHNQGFLHGYAGRIVLIDKAA